MTVQIAVRIPDRLAHFLDGVVAQDQAPSRAAVVVRALERERRRYLAERDAKLLGEFDAKGEPDDLDGLADWMQSRITIDD